MWKALLALGTAALAGAAPVRWFWNNHRVGPVTVRSTHTELAALKLARGEVQERPGETLLWALTPSRRLRVLWREDNPRRVDRVQILGPAWKNAQGIGVGTPLRRLRTLNGRPVQFSGGAAGTGRVALITDWSGGKLGPAMKNVRLFLTFSPAAQQRLSPGERQQLQGPGSLSSDSALSRRLEPRISQIEVVFSTSL